MSGLQKLFGWTGWICKSANGAGAVFGTDARTGGDVIDCPHERRFIRGGVEAFFDDRSELESRGVVSREGHTQCASADPQHEIDLFGGNALCSTDKIALVLTILVIHHNHHTSGLNCPDRLLYRLQWHGYSPSTEYIWPAKASLPVSISIDLCKRFSVGFLTDGEKRRKSTSLHSAMLQPPFFKNRHREPGDLFDTAANDFAFQ